MPTLNNWCLIVRVESPNHAPEQMTSHLMGEIHGDPRFPDGKQVVTSRVTGADGEVFITNTGARYALGDPDPVYEAKYPEARERLMKRIQQIKEE